jgi:hypothetical protein
MKVVRNPAQLAFEAMMEAPNLEAIRRAVNRLPMLSNPKFMEEMEQLEQSGFEGAPPDFAKRFRNQVAILRAAISM